MVCWQMFPLGHRLFCLGCSYFLKCDMAPAGSHLWLCNQQSAGYVMISLQGACQTSADRTLLPRRGLRDSFMLSGHGVFYSLLFKVQHASCWISPIALHNALLNSALCSIILNSALCTLHTPEPHTLYVAHPRS